MPLVPLPAVPRATTMAQASEFHETLFSIVESVNNHCPNLYSVAYEPEIKYRFRWTILGSESCMFFEMRLNEDDCSHFQLQLHLPRDILIDYFVQPAETLRQAIHNAVDTLLVAITTTNQSPTAVISPGPALSYDFSGLNFGSEPGPVDVMRGLGQMNLDSPK